MASTRQLLAPPHPCPNEHERRGNGSDEVVCLPGKALLALEASKEHGQVAEAGLAWEVLRISRNTRESGVHIRSIGA